MKRALLTLLAVTAFVVENSFDFVGSVPYFLRLTLAARSRRPGPRTTSVRVRSTSPFPSCPPPLTRTSSTCAGRASSSSTGRPEGSAVSPSARRTRSNDMSGVEGLAARATEIAAKVFRFIPIISVVLANTRWEPTPRCGCR